MVLDAAYLPRETKLLKQAKAAGCMTAHGVDMLIGQGIAAFKLFSGREAPAELIRRVIWLEYEAMVQREPMMIRDRVEPAELRSRQKALTHISSAV